MKATLKTLVIVLFLFAIVYGFWLAFLDRRSPPPRYRIQTDGQLWRWVGFENGYSWTNTTTYATRTEAVREAWKIFHANDQIHAIDRQWRDE